MTVANNLEPDEAPQKVGPHLRSKLFDTDFFGKKIGVKQKKCFCNFELIFFYKEFVLLGMQKGN